METNDLLTCNIKATRYNTVLLYVLILTCMRLAFVLTPQASLYSTPVYITMWQQSRLPK